MKTTKQILFFIITMIILFLFLLIIGNNTTILFCNNNYKETLYTHFSTPSQIAQTTPIPQTLTPPDNSNNIKFSQSIFLKTDEDVTNIDINKNPLNKKLLTQYDISFNDKKYIIDNYNIQYHDPIDIILKKDNEMTGSKGTWMLDENGKMNFVKWTDMSMQTIYYPTGTFKYGPENYVPSYEDTVLLRYYSPPYYTPKRYVPNYHNDKLPKNVTYTPFV